MGVTLANPYLGTDLEAGWSMGVAWGYIGPAYSANPPLVIHPDLAGVFNEGRIAGQQAAIEGLDVGISCVSLQQPTSPAAEGFLHGVHVFEGLGLLHGLGHLAHFGCEAFVSVFLLMIPAPPLQDPVGEFSSLADAVRERLLELGLGSGSLYLAAGIDESVENCELQFVPLFRQVDQARAAVTELGRPHWVIAEWAASDLVSGGGFRIIEAG